MINFESNLALLLFRHNEVYVPEFGSFIRKQYPSKLKSVKKQTFLVSPKEEIIFEESKQENNFLVNHFVFDLKIPISAVENEISKVVNSWKDKINNGETIEIERFGTLLKNDKGDLTFIQNDTYIINNQNEILLKTKKSFSILPYFMKFLYFILLLGLTITVALLLYLMWYFYLPI